MTELGFCTLFWELTGLFFALTVPPTHLCQENRPPDTLNAS